MEDKETRKHVTYLKMASEWSENSCCRRKKVGALIVKDNMIISDGYNGTPSGFPNDCEDANGITQWYVLHAEANAITKLAKSTQNSEGSTLYLTLSPCKDCSKLIIQSGIKRVIFKEEYRDIDGLKILREAGVSLLRIDYDGR
jgi:dCMP deaminase